MTDEEMAQIAKMMKASKTENVPTLKLTREHIQVAAIVLSFILSAASASGGFVVYSGAVKAETDTDDLDRHMRPRIKVLESQVKDLKSSQKALTKKSDETNQAVIAMVDDMSAVRDDVGEIKEAIEGLQPKGNRR